MTRTSSQVRRWRDNLADERSEAAIYRDLASKRSGEDREILLALAEAEGRHATHWETLLGEDIGHPKRGNLRSRTLGWLARSVGGVFVLALVQRAEARAKYDGDLDATPAMVADEQIHEEVVRGLAMRGRQRISGTFRAAVFGANDGLVSNLALIVAIGAAGADQQAVLLAGVAGLLAGALSMGAGEYISVRSQRELLEASAPNPEAEHAVSSLDVNANELALVYRARGMAEADAEERARAVLASAGALHIAAVDSAADPSADEFASHGTAWGAAASSFCFFASGAIIPILPFIFGMEGLAAIIVAAALVGIALSLTGAIVGLLSGTSPGTRALRQVAIGFGAAAVTYALGLLFGATTG